MKMIYKLLAWTSLLLLAGCHNVTVGYLFTDEATYSPKEMEITNIHVKLADLNRKLVLFTSQSGILQEKYDSLEVILQAKQARLDSINAIIDPIRDSLNVSGWDGFLDPNVEENAEKRAALQKRLDEELYPQQDVLGKDRDMAQGELHQAELKLQQLGEQLGVPSSAVLRRQIKEMEDRIEYQVPWVVPEMQGVLGTEPLIYEIEKIGNESAENAAKFSEYLSIIGGGKMYVDQDFDVPDGRYEISVRVTNEGRTRLFEKAFTFVVNNESYK